MAKRCEEKASSIGDADSDSDTSGGHEYTKSRFYPENTLFIARTYTYDLDSTISLLTPGLISTLIDRFRCPRQ
jgi:hypothetical protein